MLKKSLPWPEQELLLEKRSAPRRPAERQLTVRAGETAYPARCLDVSPGGLRYECDPDHPVEVGSLLEVVSLEPDLSFEGRVAWTSVGPEGRQHVGVERQEAILFSLERRRYVRVSAPDLTASCGLQSLKVLDVSLRGLRVEMPFPLPASDEPIGVDLHLPEQTLTFSAVVLESRGSIARLVIPELDPEAHQLLGRYLAAALCSSSQN